LPGVFVAENPVVGTLFLADEKIVAEASVHKGIHIGLRQVLLGTIELGLAHLSLL
jgi:hypothetical protein